MNNVMKLFMLQGKTETTVDKIILRFAQLMIKGRMEEWIHYNIIRGLVYRCFPQVEHEGLHMHMTSCFY